LQPLQLLQLGDNLLTLLIESVKAPFKLFDLGRCFDYSHRSHPTTYGTLLYLIANPTMPRSTVVGDAICRPWRARPNRAPHLPDRSPIAKHIGLVSSKAGPRPQLSDSEWFGRLLCPTKRNQKRNLLQSFHEPNGEFLRFSKKWLVLR
jgi:hypothetical protein